MAQPEAKVFNPRNTDITNDNDWPIFVLNEAEVRDAKTGELVSILVADGKRPLTMVGRLEKPEPQYLDCLRHPSRPYPIVQVANITRHAFGEYDDNGGWATWGAGESGWFEVQPSKAYENIHRDSTEAVEVLYFMKDQYEWEEGMSHVELFRRYAEGHPEQQLDSRSAARLFYKHRAFLAEEMKKKGQGIDWLQTPILQHFLRKFPELLKPSSRPPSKAGSLKSERLASARSAKGSSAHSRTTRLRSHDAVAGIPDIPDNASTTSSRRRGVTPGGYTPDELASKAKTIWKFILDTYKKFASDREDLTLDTFATELHTWYVFQDTAQASDYLCALSTPLLALMGRSRIGNWTGTGIYEALQETKLPAVSRKRALLVDLELRSVDDAERMRRLHAGLESDSSEVSDNSDAARPKSALRPKSSKFADKGAKRRAARPLFPRSSDEEGDHSVEETGGVAKRKADGPGRPGRPRKRKTSDMITTVEIDAGVDSDLEALDSPEEIELPLRRRTETVKPTAGSNGLPHSRREQVAPRARDTKDQPRPPSPNAAPPLISEAIASELPDGPSETWVCREDGCMHKVYGSRSDLGKRLIREHIEEHEDERRSGKAGLHVVSKVLPVHEGALDLLRAEEELCNLPINNLIKRIRDLTALQEGSPAFPTPLERRY